MPYSPAHRERSREQILAAASRLFPRRGFEAVSIDELMGEAGLTRGAFYHHFANKAEVYAEAIVYAAVRSPLAREKAAQPGSSDWFDATVGAYLSCEHVERAPSPCPLAFLVTDIGQREGVVRRTYTRVFGNLERLLRRVLRRNRSGRERETALAVAAMMIGGVAVARALDDAAERDRLLDACRHTARRLLRVCD